MLPTQPDTRADSQRLYYFDNNATTRIAPEVIDAMMPYFTTCWGNPSSAYSFAKPAAEGVEKARARLAALINADPAEIVFTSCGTESNNSAIHAALAMNPGKRHVLTTSVEHSANIAFGEYLKKQGYQVTFLPVEADGSLDVYLMEQSIRPDTAIVSVMTANNETGVIFPIDEVAALCRSHGVLFHTDAVQVPGKVEIDVRRTGVDFLSLSAHKLHAPKGVGLIYIKPRTRYHSYVTGGHQEHGRRGGTENVASIVGFGRAAELAMECIASDARRIRAMRDRLENTILKTVPKTARNGAKEPRLPTTSNLSFEGVEAESVLMAFDRLGICASAGSACTTGSTKPSHVLTAMGLRPERAQGSVRFSLSSYNTDQEVDFLLEHLPAIIAKLRAASPKVLATA